MSKGLVAEEQLRQYFLSTGYYVVRGAKLKHKTQVVTDVDLWLYHKSTPFARSRASVDIKYKKTPQALERVLWAKGLQQILKTDTAIVVTTEKRPFVKEFAHLHDVTVLDGSFLQKLLAIEGDQGRLTEEAFMKLYESNGDAKTTLHEWRRRYEDSKDRLLTHLNFGGCNLALVYCQFFVEQSFQYPSLKKEACRMIYVILSHFLVALDFTLISYITLEREQRVNFLLEGFMYGGDPLASNRALIFDSALSLVENYLDNGKALRLALKNSIDKAATELRLDLYAEYYARQTMANTLFSDARILENAAFSSLFIAPDDLPTSVKSHLYLLLDFVGLKRETFANAFKSDPGRQMPIVSEPLPSEEEQGTKKIPSPSDPVTQSERSSSEPPKATKE